MGRVYVTSNCERCAVAFSHRKRNPLGVSTRSIHSVTSRQTWKHVSAGLLVLLMAVPAFGQAKHPFIQPDVQASAAAVKHAADDRAKTLAHPQSDIYKEDAFNWGFWTASGLWFGASTADLVTTKFALERGGVESNPLHAQDGGRQLRWSSAIAATGGTFAFAAYCERKGHRRVARIVLITGAIVRTGLAFWNNSRRR